MEEFVNKLQDEISVFDKEYLRSIQGDMFRCSANCCDNKSVSQGELQRCLEKCSVPAMKADKFMQEQIQDIQDRFQRCAMSCADKVKDRAGFGADASTQEKSRAEMEACVGKCGDEMLKTLPQFTKRMKEWFNKGLYKQ